MNMIKVRNTILHLNIYTNLELLQTEKFGSSTRSLLRVNKGNPLFDKISVSVRLKYQINIFITFFIF